MAYRVYRKPRAFIGLTIICEPLAISEGGSERNASVVTIALKGDHSWLVVLGSGLIPSSILQIGLGELMLSIQCFPKGCLRLRVVPVFCTYPTIWFVRTWTTLIPQLKHYPETPPALPEIWPKLLPEPTNQEWRATCNMTKGFFVLPSIYLYTFYNIDENIVTLHTSWTSMHRPRLHVQFPYDTKKRIIFIWKIDKNPLKSLP